MLSFLQPNKCIEKSKLPWVEKYRPNTFDELFIDSILKQRLMMMNTTNFNSIIISGNPGIGKTTTALLLIKNLLKDPDSFLELNASDNRGINMILSLVNIFCKKKTNDNIKIILLDEADNITTKAQQQLINVIEIYKNVKFILTCNNHTHIIESLQSRMILIQFSKAKLNDVTDYLKYILNKENITFDSDVLNDIAIVTKNDFRNSVNYIEAISKVYKHISYNNFVNLFNVSYISDLKFIAYSLFDKNIIIDDIIEHYLNLVDFSHPNNDILINIIYLIENSNDIYFDKNIDMKIEIINIIYQYYFKIVDTIDSKSLIIDMLYKIKKL